MRSLLMVAATAAVLSAQNGRMDEAFFNGDRAKILRAVAERAYAMENGDAKLLAEYGGAFLAAMDVQKGKDMLRLAEAREPKDGSVLRLIAYAWLKNGYKSEALGAYEQVLRRDPKNKEAIGQSAVDLAEVSFLKDAEKFTNAFLAREPDDWRWFIAFGRAYLASGNRKPAAAWFARAVTVKPDEQDVILEIMRAFTDTQSVM
jgi:tetratricopeptide (TPR) repeat protein